MTQEQASEQIDAIRDLRDMPGMALIAARLQATILRETDDLIQFGGEKTDFVRGKIQGLRVALQVADILEGEAKTALARAQSRA